ncbi:hypothetical protein [Methylobacillus flagellatus]|uniref:hypothetical protein n=1 Tax=Methylobacillus flagellatus TaxID=405 RepID=UPI0010FA2633|nr:hypothetical protein [Methylobacillus flagellatus]
MSSLNLDTFVAVPLPIELYAELTRRYPGCVSSVIEQVSWDFLDRTAEDLEAATRGSSGVYWESLFLPEGTEIRTKYFNEYKVATIQNEEIIWNGESYPSMSQLAKSMRGDTSNNAWKVLEVKRPSDAKWQLADFLRK